MAEQLVRCNHAGKGVSRVVAVDIKLALEMAEPNCGKSIGRLKELGRNL